MMQQKTSQLGLQYVVMSQNASDIDDYRKEVIIAVHKVTPYVLWKQYGASINEVTGDVDISTAASLGIYIGVNGATTINVQVQTSNSTDGSGWSDFDSNVFSGSGYLFYNIWVLPFRRIRFQSTAAVVATIEVFLRT